MGICISCLRSEDDKLDQNLDENTPLLADNEQQQKQAVEELYAELRDKQLNNILNSANDHLIDLGTFTQQQEQQSQSTSETQPHPFPGNQDDATKSPYKSTQPQQAQDMGMSTVSHVTTTTVNSADDLISIEILPQKEVKDEIDKNLNALSRRLGPDRLEHLLAIDTSKVGPLVASFD